MTNSLALSSDLPRRSRKPPSSSNPPPPPSSSPLCEQSPFATVDIIIVIMVLCACGFLLTPYLKFLCSEAAEILPAAFVMIWEIVYQAPLAYGSGAVLILVALIGAVEILHCRSRRCQNPRCRGLKNPMEFDIQLETEECLKNTKSEGAVNEEEEMAWKGEMQLRPQHKELQNELRRMAPPNGKATLLFRASCGCPITKLEARGPRKYRRLNR